MNCPYVLVYFDGAGALSAGSVTHLLWSVRPAAAFARNARNSLGRALPFGGPLQLRGREHDLNIMKVAADGPQGVVHRA